MERKERNSLISQYFKLGYSHKEIACCLLLLHGEQLSIRQLKRVLASMGLRRKGIQTDVNKILHAIEKELIGSGSDIGYRAMWQRLIVEHGLNVNKETVRHAMTVLDPEGVQRRLKHRLRRRFYDGQGPNYLWHIDGYDKLKPFGFCVHGCIDGYSRRIMWLEVGVTNNDPSVIARYFVNCINEVGGTSRIVRADFGTENTNVAAIQRFLRNCSTDSFSGDKSFLYGKSSSNQRIEAWWSQLRKGCANWWIDHFKSLRASGIYCDSNILHVECLKFCYMGIIREELHRTVALWNNHRIRPSQTSKSPGGRPDILYTLPDIEGTENFIVQVDSSDLRICEQLLCSVPYKHDCIPDFFQLANIIMQEKNLQMPTSPESAKFLYFSILDGIANIQLTGQ